MARKLTEEERNSINLLTATLVAALPAHLRSHAGAIASSLVRIPREVVTMRDINRIVGRCGENKKQKDELRDAIREFALMPAYAGDDGAEAFVLRLADGDAAEEAIDAEAPSDDGAGADSAAADAHDDGRAEKADEAVAEPADEEPEAASAAEKPARRTRRRRHVGDKGGLREAAEAEAQEAATEPVAAAESVAASDARAMDGAAEETASPAPETPAAEVPAQAVEDGASQDDAAATSPDAASDSAAEPAKKRRRTRRSRKKSAKAAEGGELAPEAEAATGADAPAGEVPAAEASAGEAPAGEAKPEEEPLSLAMVGAVEAEAADGRDEGPSQAGPEGAQTAGQSEQPEQHEQPSQADGAKQPEAGQQPSRGGRGNRGRGRRGGQGNGGAPSGNPKQQGKTLAEVPYIRRGGQNEAELRARIVQLDQRFWMNGWLLSHPGAFQLYEKELLALNEFLVSGTMIGDVTRRQLAYQMGGDEKFFEYGSDGFKLLRSMGVEDLIRHRPLPKADLLFHAPRRRKHMCVLVTENLDPWLDVHDLMYEDGVSQILGQRIHAVVLGGGMPVLEQNRLHLLLDTLGADSYEVLYWGDIDRAGLDILIKLQALLDGKFEVKAFTPAYQLMCDRAMERFPDPADNEKTGQINIEVGDTSVICDGLTPEAAAYAKAVIENCSLIPQEILTKRDL